ncbi:serine-rich adhesin for platelets isoform X2 [Folsomia candida]|nr:serine-rich adhesin for platelets isoform X2 [Folsomia candida]
MNHLRNTYHLLRKSRSSIMAPPPSTTASSGAPTIHPSVRDVTEDTPADLLEGTMELLVVLPSTSTVRMTVDRRTPMLDILINVGTHNKLNPGDHIAQVRNQRGFELPYKPSTPIGALDTTTIEIVPKNKVNDYIVVKKPSRVANQPFEHTFRLQVHLPRNQLYVMRVSMKTVLEDILKEVCQEKNLDILKYEIRHPGNLDERLPLNGTLGEFGLHEITVVSKNTKISNSVSTADIIALQQTDNVGRGKGYLDSSFKHSRSSVGDSSVSSGSTGSARGLSPTRSDDSRSASPFSMHSPGKLSHRPNSGSSSDVNRPVPAVVHKSMSMSNMFSPAASTSPASSGIHPPPRNKKRAAPLPPPLLKSLTMSSMPTASAIDEKHLGTRVTPKKKEAPRAPALMLKSSLTSSATQLNQSAHHHHESNHSRHSSGSSGGYNEGGVFGLTQNELHRYDRQSSSPAMLSRQTIAKSASNLTTTSSTSNTSLASSSGGGSKKRKAPTPPTALPPLKPQSEIDEEDYSESSSLSGPVGVPATANKSDKKTGQPQNSVEVKVDVHKSSITADVHASTPISVNTCKEEDQYSFSTPASSLSSPGSYLSSSSTSPLPPNTETPGPATDLNPNSSPTILQGSNFCSSSSEPVVDSMQSSDHTPTGSSQVPAPLPPPRKTREVPLQEGITEQPQPKPRPKPRLDRKSSDSPAILLPDLVSKPSLTSSDNDEEESGNLPPQAQPVHANQLRNPLSRYGVKVLPDQVLKERADRLAKAASTTFSDNEDRSESKYEPSSHSKEGGSGGSVASRNKKTSAPPPPTNSSTTIKPPLPPSSKNSAFQLRKRDSDSSSPSESTKIVKDESKPYKAIPKRQKSQDEDSDNLEENLELFEPVISKPSKHNLISWDSPTSSLSSGTGQPNNLQTVKTPSAPHPQSSTTLKLQSSVASNDTISTTGPKDSSRVLSSSVSDFQEFKRKSGDKEKLQVDAMGLVRTNSDRLANTSKDNSHSNNISLAEDGKMLNRWQNLESLNESSTDPSDASNHKNTNNLPTVKGEVARNTSAQFAKRSHAKLSSSDRDFHEGKLNSVDQTDDVDDAGHTSSESEVSYTDSGIPTTITPSPMDFDARISDHDDDDPDSPTKEKTSESRGSSNRSSFRSDEGDQWRDVLKKKAENSHEAREKTFQSMLPQSLNNVETKDKIKLDSDELNNYQNRTERSSTDDDQNLTKESTQRHSSSESASSRKLSKSESFSEFEFIQMKRKQFAVGDRYEKVQSLSSNLSSSRHSSSEEDLTRSTETQVNKNIKSETTEVARNPMYFSSGGVKQQEKHEIKAESSSLHKTTSLNEIQKSESSSQNDPELMKAIQSQLEEQFEQWKLDFIKNQVEPGTTTNDSKSQVEREKEQENKLIVESSGAMDSSKRDSYSSDDGSDENPVPSSEPLHRDEYSHQPSSTVTYYSEETTTYHNNLEGTRSIRSSEQVRDNKPIQKYTGPPTINMGSWTERPRTTVSVKKDEDYIMGFGQANPKVTPTVESRSAGKAPQKPFFNQSFNQSTTSSPKPAPQVISPTFRSVVETVAPSSKPDTPSPNNNNNIKGISATLNARPISSVDSVDSVSTIKSVLSTWKQRVESSEDQKKKNVSQGHPPEIDIYENESPNTFTRTHNQKFISLHEESSSNDSVKMPKLQIVDVGANVNIEASKEKFDFQRKMPESERPVIISREPPPLKKPATNQEPAPSLKTHDTVDLGKPSKPMFKISSMESKPKLLSQVQVKEIEPPVQTPSSNSKENVVLRKSQISLDISFPVENDGGPSFKERKRYFQGISPVESPSKEVPLPAVNLKTSIATIQKVFEQRQQRPDSNSPSPSPTPTLQRNLASIPTKPVTVVVEPAPKIIKSPPPDNAAAASAVPFGQATTPRQFQMMSSAEMVQRVLGKSSKPSFDAFRRSPSPISSTSSTLSRTSSGRNTPSSSAAASEGVVENSTRITNEIKKSAPHNIKNVGNKSIIIVEAQAEPVINTDASKPSAGSVSNNVFKLQNSLSISGGGAGQKKPVAFGEGNNNVKRNNSITTTTTITLNGEATSTFGNKIPFNERRQSNLGKESQGDTTSVSIVERKSSIPTNGGGPPPPPPPPPSSDTITRPQHISFSNRPKSEIFSSPSSNKSSTPSSPSGSDPRSEIFNVIKQSNGNFGLKKTGSTFLLK